MKKNKIVMYTGKGDETICEWEIGNETETKKAEKEFNDLIAKNFAAIRTKPDEGKIVEFDPFAEEIIIIKPMAGG